MMSQQSGGPCAALIRVNSRTGSGRNGNRDIRGETRVEYQGRQEGQQADISPKQEKQSRVKTQ